jgi:hypothetical protein
MCLFNIKKIAGKRVGYFIKSTYIGIKGRHQAICENFAIICKILSTIRLYD